MIAAQRDMTERVNLERLLLFNENLQARELAALCRGGMPQLCLCRPVEPCSCGDNSRQATEKYSILVWCPEGLQA